MGWLTQIDPQGGLHIVFSQEAKNSCGIACVTMAVFKVNKLNPSAGMIHTEKEIDKVYSGIIGKSYDGSAYSNMLFLDKTLNKLNCGIWKTEAVDDVSEAIVNSVGVDYQGLGTVGSVVNAIKRGNPIIIHVGWFNGGAHFVLIDTVYRVGTTLYAIVCDPADGNVHMTEFKPGWMFDYKGAKIPLSLNLGQSHGDYKATTYGRASGWVLRKIG